MKTLITDGFDGETPDDIDTEYERLIADYRAEQKALNDRLFDAMIALYKKES